MEWFCLFLAPHAYLEMFIDAPPPVCPCFLIGNRLQSKLYSMGEQEGGGEDSEEGKRNNILQKAILLYIGFVSL